MQRWSALPIFFFVSQAALAQPRPLEEVLVEGSRATPAFVAKIAGLTLESPFGQSEAEAALARVVESGLFSSVTYRVEPGKRRGYVLKFSVQEGATVAAAIDIPGADDEFLWRSLSQAYPALDHRVPESAKAQQFVAGLLQDLAKESLGGQSVVAELESDLRTGQMLVSMQPQNLPKISTFTFVGAREIAPDRLAAILNKVIGGKGYTDRRFREVVEANLRGAYEEGGMYRVRFPRVGAAKLADGTVRAETEVEEGPKFKLREVAFKGEGIEPDALRKAGRFEKGQIADWSRIQKGIDEAERTIRNAGYLDASAKAQRQLDDVQLTLDVSVTVNRGVLYRFGKLILSGLPPAQEAQVRKSWKLASGEPLDLNYAQKFLRDDMPRELRGVPVKIGIAPSGPGIGDFSLFFGSN
ncbi:MAG: hypothetical protein SFV18_07220 [Bryobacteraceae bacterium]|nr:hypothetical protein [Bryobacteraceae bacterium]